MENQTQEVMSFLTELSTLFAKADDNDSEICIADKIEKNQR